MNEELIALIRSVLAAELSQLSRRQLTVLARNPDSLADAIAARALPALATP